jgi:hypothetical protein
MISPRILPPKPYTNQRLKPDMKINDSMATSAARPEPKVDEWRPAAGSQETPSLLSFKDREGSNAKNNSQECMRVTKSPDSEDISELLTRKFREFFP